jgi:hypothetical protein
MHCCRAAKLSADTCVGNKKHMLSREAQAGHNKDGNTPLRQAGWARALPILAKPRSCKTRCLCRTCRSMSLGPTHLRLPALPSSARPLQMASSYLHSSSSSSSRSRTTTRNRQQGCVNCCAHASAATLTVGTAGWDAPCNTYTDHQLRYRPSWNDRLLMRSYMRVQD